MRGRSSQQVGPSRATSQTTATAMDENAGSAQSSQSRQLLRRRCGTYSRGILGRARVSGVVLEVAVQAGTARREASGRVAVGRPPAQRGQAGGRGAECGRGRPPDRHLEKGLDVGDDGELGPGRQLPGEGRGPANVGAELFLVARGMQRKAELVGGASRRARELEWRAVGQGGNRGEQNSPRASP